MYVSSYEEETPTLVSDLVPNPTSERTRNAKQNEKENKTEKSRRILLELSDEENDLDYYSDLDSDSDYSYQTYV